MNVKIVRKKELISFQAIIAEYTKFLERNPVF